MNQSKKLKLILSSVAALFVSGLRQQFATANASNATAQGTHAGPMTFRVDAALTKTNLLVKAGTDERHVDLCGAANYPVGIAIGEVEAIEDTVAVMPLAPGQTLLARCATALAANIDLYTAAGGLVVAEPASAGTYYKVGRSKRLAVLESSTDNYQIEFEPCFPVKLVVVAALGTGSVGALAADLQTAFVSPALVKILP